MGIIIIINSNMNTLTCIVYVPLTQFIKRYPQALDLTRNPGLGLQDPPLHITMMESSDRIFSYP